MKLSFTIRMDVSSVFGRRHVKSLSNRVSAFDAVTSSSSLFPFIPRQHPSHSQHQPLNLPKRYHLSLALCLSVSHCKPYRTLNHNTTSPAHKQQHPHNGPVPRAQRPCALPRPRQIRKLTSCRLRPHYPSNLLPKHLRLRRAAATTQHPQTRL
jgi:hypothetical protein